MTKRDGSTEDLRTRLECTAGLSNEILSDSEQKIARVLLSESLAHTGPHDGEIVERVGRLRVALAPHKNLPPELLAKVFVDCIYDIELCIPLNIPPLEPWVFGQICSRWRAIALAEPRLWNRIYIQEPFPPARSLEIFHHLLTLIGNLPIDIHFRNSQRKTVIFDILTVYAHRIRNLTFLVDSYMTTQLATVSQRFDVLESLSMRFIRGRETPEHIPLVASISASESLRTLTIEGVHVFGRIIPLETIGFGSKFVPSNRLMNLTISSGVSLSPSMLMNIFHHCTWLVHCDVAVSGDPEGYQISSSEITLDHLRSFMVFVAAQDLGPLLAPLVCPGLRILDFMDAELPNIPWPEEMILDFVSRSPNIDWFKGTICVISEHCYMQLAKAMPGLVKFHVITNVPISERALDTMREENILPNLETFVVRVTSSCAISKLLSSRWSRAPSGRFEGISDITILISHQHFTLEEESFDALETALKLAGRKSHLIVLLESDPSTP